MMQDSVKLYLIRLGVDIDLRIRIKNDDFWFIIVR